MTAEQGTRFIFVTGFKGSERLNAGKVACSHLTPLFSGIARAVGVVMRVATETAPIALVDFVVTG